MVGFLGLVETAEGRCEHVEGALGQLEVGHHGGGHMEVVGREDELVGPPFVGLDVAQGVAGRLHGALHGGADGHHLLAHVLGAVDDVAVFLFDGHFLRIHLVLGEVFHVGLAEVAQSAVKGDEGAAYVVYLHALQHFAAEVEPRGGRGDGPFVLGKVALEALQVFRLRLALDDLFWVMNCVETHYLAYKRDKKPVLRYMCGDYEISDDQLTNITEYLTRHKKEFVTSRYDREFYNMQSIVSVLGVNKIVSFGCVPISVDEELTGYIIAAIDLHDNMTNNIVFLDRNDITIFKFALSQLTDNLYRLKARDEISQMNKKLQRSAVTDLLTGLMNRQGFAKKVGDYEELVRSGKKENICATVLYIDLDNFKLCNDTFGHAVGDVILKCFSRLIERVADSESYVVRYGGDEFLLIMPGHELDDGIVVAKEIYNQLKIENNFIDDIEEAVHGTVDISPDRRVSCSIGIASVDKYDRESVDLALKHADSKLYAVKKSEKSNYSVWRDEIDGE